MCTGGTFRTSHIITINKFFVFRLDKIAIKTYFKNLWGDKNKKRTLEQRSRKIYDERAYTYNYVIVTRCQVLSFKWNVRLGFLFLLDERCEQILWMRLREKKKWFLFYSIERSSRILFINHSLFVLCFFFYELSFFRWYCRAKPKPRIQTETHTKEN